jgi:hypothetical protein
MAIEVTKRVVCDLGAKHTGEIRQWRITVDGKSKTFDLCPSCARSLVALWERGGDAKKAPSKMRVVTLSEIEAEKQKAPPTSS